MESFNLQNSLAQWRKSLRKQQGLEPGYIEEIESNLLDRYDDYLAEGLSESESFKLAAEKTVINPELVADEYFQANTSWKQTPPWKRRFDLIYLLPNYLKIAGRNFMRKSAYTTINLIGLVLGIMSVALVYLYISYKTTFDEFHTKADQIYRVGQNYRSQGYSMVGFEDYFRTSSEKQLSQINGLKNTAGILDAAQFFIFDAEAFVETGAKKLPVGKILSTNTCESFFDMFDFSFIQGSKATAAQNYGQAVLTSTTAQKLFGEDWQTQDILSSTLKVEDSTYIVAGVIEDVPSQSHFEFNILLHDKRITFWGTRTYVQLEPTADVAMVKERADQNMDKINPRLAESEIFAGLLFQPITSIHLNSNLLYEIKPPGDIRYLYAFGLIGLVILLITITNYTNLSIAMNAGRNREIGMRKVMGAARKSVTIQFLMEAIIMALAVTPVVLILLQLILPVFNDFMQVSLTNQFLEFKYLLLLLFTALLIGVLAGIYPAFYLSGRKIQDLFTQGAIKAKTRGFSVRKMLIAFQFALLIGLVSVTYFINQQITFIDQKDLGYRSEGILYVDLPSEKYPQFKQQVTQLPAIKAVGTGSFLGRNPFNQLTYKLENTTEVFDDATSIYMDYDAVKAYGLTTTVNAQLDDPESPEEFYLINETAAKALARQNKLERGALIGKQIIEEPEYTQEDGTVGFPKTIDGFFNDINLFSLREKVEPYFLTIVKNPEWTPRAIIHFETGQITELMQEIQAAYDGLEVNTPMSYQFQSDNLKKLYEKEQRVAQLSIYLSAVAVLLAVVGLVALSAFLTSLKRKELGIRKVLGASVFQILKQFSKEYVLLVVISLLVATPFAYCGISQWLAGFAYAITINPVIFVITAIGTLAVAWLAVSWITIKAAQANPIDSLKEDQ
ncbi:ABC transporter permease [Fulvivirga sp. RKSG066]|uniref:FtsX-like permease family protein n=1 Tax=Fulvivirga aurantia TaxID=2529383 RepID=UPI0012BC0388|nr:FtsX-like permease family protein [Fulvivirga aurantia]MTI22544.1 ABC transporter permease [Fulvivirga aurantia]